MAAVDPDDDSITRWVLWHFRYDPARRERRNVVVAAYDNEAEFKAHLASLHDSLVLAKAEGTAELTERLGGVIKPAGYSAAVAASRLRPRPKKHRERKRR